MADGGEDDVYGVSLAAFEMAAAEVSVALRVADDGLVHPCAGGRTISSLTSMFVGRLMAS